MYKIVWSNPVKNELDTAYDKLINESFEPIIADNLIIDFYEKLEHLEFMPFSRMLVDDYYLSKKGIRTILVKNYILIFTINEQRKIVNLVRFLPSRSDWMNILKEDFDNEDS